MSLTIGDIKELVKSLMAEGTDTGTEEKPKDEPVTGTGATDVSAQVREEIAKLEARKTKEQREKEQEDKIAALEAKVAEKAPVEYGRLHKIMKWGE